MSSVQHGIALGMGYEWLTAHQPGSHWEHDCNLWLHWQLLGLLQHLPIISLMVLARITIFARPAKGG